MKKNIFRKFGILAIYLFGSIVEGTETKNSDIDIGIVFKDPLCIDDTLNLYTMIQKELSNVLKIDKKREIDIVFLQKASLPVQYNAIINGKVIYEDDAFERLNYEENIINHYMDFKPFLEYFDKMLIKRYL